MISLSETVKKIVMILSLKIPPHLKCVTTLPYEISDVLKATIENKTTSEVKRPTLIVTKFFYKRTKLFEKIDHMPMTSVMTSLGTERRISK